MLLYGAVTWTMNNQLESRVKTGDVDMQKNGSCFIEIKTFKCSGPGKDGNATRKDDINKNDKQTISVTLNYITHGNHTGGINHRTATESSTRKSSW